MTSLQPLFKSLKEVQQGISELSGPSDFEVYYKYARNLTARMIVEMLAHGIESIEELDKDINMSGVGDFVKRSG